MIKKYIFVSKDINDYCENKLPKESEILNGLAKETEEKTEWPSMMAGHFESNLLKILIQLIKAKKVLEIGTFTGYSTLSIAEALPSNGKIITCEIEPKFISIAQKYWSKSKAGKKIKVLLGPAERLVKHLGKNSFDMAFIDADKENYPVYYELCLNKVKKGGLIVIDNTLWKGKVVNPKSKTSIIINNLNRRIKNDKRVESIILPIRDGITLVFKK